jgi:stage V sporulation protein G
MEITRTFVRLANPNDRGLKAYCSVTFDNSLAVNDIKILKLQNRILVAMPGRKVTAPCDACQFENPVQAKFCTECGVKLSPTPKLSPTGDRIIRFIDVVHPINRELRNQIEAAVMSAYTEEMHRLRPHEAPVRLG